MDNFSAIASLVLFGLFLITCPAEGFVTGYRYIDLSEPRFHFAPMKRQEDNRVDADELARIEAEMANGEEIMFASPDNEPIPSRPIYYHNSADPKNGKTLAGAGVTENQNQDTTTDAEKRVDVVPLKADERKVKASQLNNERQNNENDFNAQNTNSITVIVTYPSKP